MRKIIIIVLIVIAVIAAVAIYLVATTPDTTRGVALPLSASERELLTRVPRSAEAFALIPTAAALQETMLANPVTHEPLLDWTAKHPLPPAWLLGGADVVLWKSGKKTSYAVRLEPFRTFVARLWLITSSDVVARWDGKVFLINADDEQPIDAAELTSLLDFARGLPNGDAFVVQRETGRGVFPPIARPAVSTVKITTKEIEIASRARAESPTATATLSSQLPRGAMLAVAFAKPPRVVEDLNRLLGTRVSALVDNGGTIAIYDVNAGTLLPRPKGVIVAPATAESRVAFEDIARVANLVGETRDTGNELLVAFDRTSLPLYLKDTFAPARWPANEWTLRLDPRRFIPILERLGDSTGLRFAAPRLHRAARDLRRWIRALQNAQTIEASASTAGGTEELRVRIGV
ncbi:MAG TPA: hypothetical protein VMU84_16930 [Thermoanaerobaculia bacterium]|nr:hypothetical protein [Thermoanaerobaculia bacterium]